MNSHEFKYGFKVKTSVAIVRFTESTKAKQGGDLVIYPDNQLISITENNLIWFDCDRKYEIDRSNIECLEIE